MALVSVPTAVKQVQHSCGRAKNSFKQLVNTHSAVSAADEPVHEVCRQVANGINTAIGQGAVVSKPSRGMVPDSSCRDEKEYGNVDSRSFVIL